MSAMHWGPLLALVLGTGPGCNKEPEPEVVEVQLPVSAGWPVSVPGTEPARGHPHFKVPADSPHRMGPDDAPVTVVAVLDLQDARSADSFRALEGFARDHSNDVRTLFVFRDGPNPPAAFPAYEYAFAADAQGKFWPFVRAVFSAGGRTSTPADLERVAQRLGLDVPRMKASVASGAARQSKGWLAFEAHAAPVAYVNGELVQGNLGVHVNGVVASQRFRAKRALAAGVPADQVYDFLTASLSPVSKEAAARSAAEVRPPPPPVPLYKVPADSPHRLGPDTAKVTIVTALELSTFGKKMFLLLERLLARYPEDVRIVAYFHRPLSGVGFVAYAYALAAGREGKFWDFVRGVYGIRPYPRLQSLEALARSLDLDVESMRAFVDSGAGRDMKGVVDFRLGSSAPVTWVNGERVEKGAFVTFEQLVEIVERQLARAEAMEVEPRRLYEALVRDGESVAHDRRSSGKLNVVGQYHIPTLKGVPSMGNRATSSVHVDVFVVPQNCGQMMWVLNQKMKRYPGELSVTFRQWTSTVGALAVVAAGRQRRGLEMQSRLCGFGLTNREDILVFARDLGLDVERFERDLDRPGTKARVEREGASLPDIPVREGIFVNGHLLGSLEHLEGLLERELSAALELQRQGKTRPQAHRALTTNAQRLPPSKGRR